MSRLRRQVVAALLACASLLDAGCASIAHRHDDPSYALVNKATISILLLANGDEHPDLVSALKGACAVLLFPGVKSLSVIVGGSAGNGVLLVKDPTTGRWNGPAFYSLTRAGIGPQVGITASEVVIVMRSCDALGALYADESGVGLDVAAALGSHGSGHGASSAGDLLAFSRVKGLYAGVSLEGWSLRAQPALAADYYEQALTPEDILVRRVVVNPAAAELQHVLESMTK
jgi:SH3 domain-containing YSC84-like protein 1